MLILVTGATGKVGRHFIAGLLDDPRSSRAGLRALCLDHSSDETDHVGVVRGSDTERHVIERHVIAAKLDGVTRSVHLASCKEAPNDVTNVMVNGLFWTLEGFRAILPARQFNLIGGNAGLGHFGSAWKDGGSPSDRHVVR